MKIQNALVSNILDWSQRYFAHVTTVTLSWRVLNIVVIGHVYFTLECFEISSNFEFDRNMLSGTGARLVNVSMHHSALKVKMICTRLNIAINIHYYRDVQMLSAWTLIRRTPCMASKLTGNSIVCLTFFRISKRSSTLHASSRGFITRPTAVEIVTLQTSVKF